jgi:hypothetical protein
MRSGCEYGVPLSWERTAILSWYAVDGPVQEEK